MKVVIAGGGTGGHLYPGLAIAEALRRRSPDIEVLFVGGDRLERRVVPQEGWPFRSVAARGLPRRVGLGVIRTLAATMLGTIQALRLLWGSRPDVVIATGGYVCAPVGFAAVLTGAPLVVQEQNLHPGLTTRVLARWAQWVSVPHGQAAGRLRARRIETTGVPIRRKALDGDRPRGLARWNLEPGRFTLLVLGGSQGAHSLNRAACRLGDLLMYETRLQVLHQTGTEDLSWVREQIGHREHVGPPALHHVAAPFFEAVGDAYACADLVLCRAGASTLAEVTAWGLPCILVPYPYAAHAHQEENAEILTRAGAAIRIGDAQLSDTALVETVQSLLGDVRRRTAMATASRALGRPDAAEVVAGLVIDLGGDHAAQEVRA